MPMDHFECPKGSDNKKCEFRARSGSVRDANTVGVKECQECSMVIHSEPLRNLVKYESGSMRNWSNGYGDRTNKPSNDTVRRFDAIVDLSRTHSISRILDVGCGEGQMVKKFTEAFHAEGVEPEDRAREICIKSGLRVHNDLQILEDTGELFDAISMFHVVEHIYKPFDILRQLKKLLRPNGILLIETPNSMDALLTMYECSPFQNFTYWSHHPMLYSPTALAYLVSRSGYKILENVGVQRYSIENHMHWLSKGKPGGHEVWNDMFSSEAKHEYAKCLIEKKVSDTLWMIATKA